MSPAPVNIKHVFSALDTNGDGVATTPAPGRWGRIQSTGQAQLTLRNAGIYYGGGGNDGRCCAGARATDGTLSINGGTATIQGSIIRFSQGNGIRVNGGTGLIERNELSNHARFGLSFGDIVCSDWGILDLVYQGNGEGDQEGCL